MYKLIALCLISALLNVAGCVTTTPEIQTDSIEVTKDVIKVQVSFGETDRQRIKAFYSEKDKGAKSKKMPPGLDKKQELPPGLQKHIARYGVLPAGLQDRNLPLELERTLSPLPRGYVRLKLGGDVVLMEEKTRIAVDVIRNLNQ